MKHSLNIGLLKNIPENKKLTQRGRLLRSLIETIIELKRYPSDDDLKLISLNRISFPDYKSFETLGSQQERIEALKSFCIQFSLNEIIPFCSLERVNSTTNGSVYLYKAESYYKIGRTINVERRDREIKLQLPFKAELIHVIETSDPKRTEKYWHDFFKSKRQNGEWFCLLESDVRLFKSKTFM